MLWQFTRSEEKFFIGEAKPRVDQIAKSDIKDLAATANELKANVAMRWDGTSGKKLSGSIRQRAK